MEDEEYQFESNLEEEEDYGFGESSDESTEEIVDYEGMKEKCAGTVSTGLYWICVRLWLICV